MKLNKMINLLNNKVIKKIYIDHKLQKQKLELDLLNHKVVHKLNKINLEMIKYQKIYLKLINNN